MLRTFRVFAGCVRVPVRCRWDQAGDGRGGDAVALEGCP